MTGKRVLLVDDDADTVVYLSTLLEDNGLETEGARNANEAWEVIESEETHDYNYFLED